MKNTLLDFAHTGKFDRIFNDYLSRNQALQAFYGLFPDIDNFAVQIEKFRNFSRPQRQVLHQALLQQYRHTERKPQLALDLLLKDNTFTITTGHQLNIFTGPLYFHYKIITVINAARQLRERFPQYHFIPVYWMASEDHDAAEISSFSLFGKKYSWQPEQKGAVGRFSPASLQGLIRQLPEMHPLFTNANTRAATLADATRDIVNQLYGHEGLVVVDGDDALLKAQFKNVLREELLHEPACKAIEQSSAQLAALGYKIQVHPREINLFYLDGALRERIVKNNVQGRPRYEVLNSPLSFSEEEILALVEQSPERFSPNVVLRPLYQEIILPNISYTGGPGELAYWLQLKGVFEHFGVPFPILLPRNHALYLPAAQRQRMQQFELAAADLFNDEKTLRDQLMQRLQAPPDLSQEMQAFEEMYQAISHKVLQLNSSMTAYLGARRHEMEAQLGKIGKKLQKMQEEKYALQLGQLHQLLEKCFPKGGLQERSENFLSFYLNDASFLQKIADTFDPFDFRFNVIED